MIYRHPRDDYVARFFGEVNLLSARCTDGGIQTPFGFVPTPERPHSVGPLGWPCVLTRPEDILVSHAPADGPTAVVRRVQQAGSRQRLLLTLEGCGAEECQLTAAADAALRFQPGDRVYVRVRPGAVRILSRSSGGARQEFLGAIPARGRASW